MLHLQFYFLSRPTCKFCKDASAHSWYKAEIKIVVFGCDMFRLFIGWVLHFTIMRWGGLKKICIKKFCQKTSLQAYKAKQQTVND